MKNRTATIVLALCFLSSMSFAENVTDAPLVVSDPYATASDTNQNATPMKRHHEKKKDKECPAQQTAQNKDKNDAQPSRAPSQSNDSPTM